MFSAKYSLGSLDSSAPGLSQYRCRLNAWSIRYMKWGTQPASASTHTIFRSGWRSNTPPKTSMAMMSWQPRTMDKNPLIAGPLVRPLLVVRMWKLSGSSSSTAVSQSSS